MDRVSDGGFLGDEPERERRDTRRTTSAMQWHHRTAPAETALLPPSPSRSLLLALWREAFREVRSAAAEKAPRRARRLRRKPSGVSSACAAPCDETAPILWHGLARTRQRDPRLRVVAVHARGAADHAVAADDPSGGDKDGAMDQGKSVSAATEPLVHAVAQRAENHGTFSPPTTLCGVLLVLRGARPTDGTEARANRPPPRMLYRVAMPDVGPGRCTPGTCDIYCNALAALQLDVTAREPLLRRHAAVRQVRTGVVSVSHVARDPALDALEFSRRTIACLHVALRVVRRRLNRALRASVDRGIAVAGAQPEGRGTAAGGTRDPMHRIDEDEDEDEDDSAHGTRPPARTQRRPFGRVQRRRRRPRRTVSSPPRRPAPASARTLMDDIGSIDVAPALIVGSTVLVGSTPELWCNAHHRWESAAVACQPFALDRTTLAHAVRSSGAPALSAAPVAAPTL